MNAPHRFAAPASGPADVPTFEELAADPEIAPLLDFTPAHRKVQRPDGWTPDLQREFIARLADLELAHERDQALDAVEIIEPVLLEPGVTRPTRS